ncbi:MAG: hypothetical protein R3250_13685, partial [Melioribacteraceae bacterium]|nr:hypothetical protein [Melioribacteraceae bacterium]
PIAKKVQFDFQKENYSVLVVDTGGNHADLTEDYAAIPSEMKAVARIFGKEVLREVSVEQIYDNVQEIRNKLGDRAVLRSFHFVNENKRVSDQVTALMSGDFTKFLSIIKASGDSSYKLLQNIYTTKNVMEQGISLALAVTENYMLKVNAGACRVHGGGFAGTILAFLPKELVENYIKEIEPIFGKNSVTVLAIRQYGTLYLNDFE